MGLLVGNDPNGWDNLTQFAQQREEFNSVSREEDGSKKKVVREILSLSYQRR